MGRPGPAAGVVGLYPDVAAGRHQLSLGELGGLEAGASPKDLPVQLAVEKLVMGFDSQPIRLGR